MRKFTVPVLVMLFAALLVGCGTTADVTPTPGLAEPSPTVAGEASPTVAAEPSPTVAAEVSPTVEEEASPTVEADTTPTAEAEVSPTVEADTTPTAEAEASPTAEADTTPTGEAEASPTAEADTTPTGEAEASPTAEAEAGETPGAVAEGDPKLGAEIFAVNCSGCHGPDAGGGIGPALAGTDLPYEHVLETVRTGPSDMPAFPPEQVSDEDVADILAWLQSLA